MVHSVVLSEKGQLVIPKHIRKKYGFGKGTKLLIFEEKGKLILEGSDSVVERLKFLNDMPESALQSTVSEEVTPLQNNVELPAKKRDAREIT